MKILLRGAALVLLLALGWWLRTIFFPSPEKVILKRMASLAETVSFNAGASSISRAAKALSFIGYFSADAQIVVDVPELGAHTMSGRDEIRETGNSAFAALPGLRVAFLDTNVRVGADQQTADVATTVSVRLGGDKDFNVEELHFQWKKIDGAWLVTRAETVKTLK